MVTKEQFEELEDWVANLEDRLSKIEGDKEKRREYMRNYMRERRAKERDAERQD